MFEIIFLIALAIIWMSFGSIQDLRQREISNWLNFSLIIFALAFRFFYSLFNSENFLFFYQGLIWLGIFFVVGNLFYYSRLFAGGDAKLLIALGPVLPLSYDWIVNLKIFITFILLFLIGGSIYSIFYAFGLMSANWDKFKTEFAKKLASSLKMILIVLIGVITWVIIMFFLEEKELILIGLIFLLFPIL